MQTSFWRTKSLDNAYLNAKTMFIQGKIDSVANFHVSKQHAAWKVMNEISNRKDHPSIKLKEDSPVLALFRLG